MAIEIVDFPIKNCDFPWQNVSSPEGTRKTWRFKPLSTCFFLNINSCVEWNHLAGPTTVKPRFFKNRRQRCRQRKRRSAWVQPPVALVWPSYSLETNWINNQSQIFQREHFKDNSDIFWEKTKKGSCKFTIQSFLWPRGKPLAYCFLEYLG